MQRQLSLSEIVRRRMARASRRRARGAFGFWAWSRGGDLRSQSRRGQETRAECKGMSRAERRRSRRARRGSTLLVVLALLGMLSLLGLIYFTFANQEQQNATYFAEAAKKVTDGDDIDAIFDAAMKQLILGADTTQKNSVMWGRRHSMLFNLIGFDLQPHSGSGVNLIRDSVTGEVVVDQDRNGANDFTQGTPPYALDSRYDLRNVNDSPAAAAGGQLLFERNILAMPAPDVDYTFPDHNNMFLAHKGYTWDYNTTPPTLRLVVKPSFHRPELLRDASGSPRLDWAVSGSTGGRLFRPHPQHYYAWRQNTTAAPERRFIIDASSNPGGDPTLTNYVSQDVGLIGASPTSQVRAGFPFIVNLNDPATGTPDGYLSEQGVFNKNVNIAGQAAGAWDQYEYDVDNDNDTVPDGIWMDLDLPVLSRASDGRTFVPLISTAIYDLGGLLDVNMVGNTFGDTTTNPTTNFGQGGSISVSFQGLSSPAEINPTYALDTVFTEASAEAQADLVGYFGHAPASALEMANMEYWLSLKGHVRYSTPNRIYAGRFGEANRMWNVLQQGGAPISVHATAATRNLFPYPGVWDADDNRDANEGYRIWMGGTAVGTIDAFRHPLAFGGRGRFWNLATPKQMLTHSVAANPLSFIAYVNILTGFDAASSASAGTLVGGPQWLGIDPFGAGGNPLMTNTLFGANYGLPTVVNPANVNDYLLVDDSMEVTVEPKSVQRPYDEVFEALDTLYLQMSNSDRNTTGITSRIADTMPGNMVIPTGAGTPNQLLAAQRFTSVSWDLKQFGLPRISGPGPDGAPGIAGFDDDNNGVVDDSGELGFPGTQATWMSTPNLQVSDDDRVWEFNVDSDGNGYPEFPPQFNPVLPSQATGQYPCYVPAIDPNGSVYRPENAYGPRDPFRPQLRRLLSTEFGSTQRPSLAKKLNFNEFLDIERRPNAVVSSYTSPLQYRALTPHSTDNSVQNLPTPTPATPTQAYQEPYTLPVFPPAQSGSFSAEEVKEFWARRDRQQMARDIYVLLYTFCGGDDSSTGNVTTKVGFTPGPAAGPYLHSANVRRQMAQFAVNLVDALDSDNVVTAFEYDNDLSNGWGLDDDPATNTEGLSNMERDVVFGVEAPQLTFSEVAWYRQLQQTADNTQTPYDDMTGEFNFVQFELRSIFPQTVQLADPLSSNSNANTGIWRIIRDDNNNGTLDIGGATGAAENAFVFSNGAGSISPGGLFTIATSDSGSLGPGGYQSSAIYIDHTGATTDFELVCPNKVAGPYSNTTGQPGTVVDLDLLHPNHTNRFALASGSPGDFLSRTNNPTTNPDTDPQKVAMANRTVFRLQRRLNPRLPQLSIAVNPFVTVDVASNDATQAAGTIGFAGSLLGFDGAVTDQTTAMNRLPLIDASTERGQPLDNNRNSPANGLVPSTGVGPSPMLTSFSAANSTSPAQFSERLTFLPHFDRDFSSVVELFHIPLFGPSQLTRSVPGMWLPPELAPATPPGADFGQLRFANGPLSFGAALLLQSEDRDHDGTLAASEDTNGNGVYDTTPDEDTNGNGRLDFGEDINNNGVLDSHPYHFHRLFALAEVPTRTHRQLGDPLQVNRVPGRLNLNGIRDPRVLAGLIDDLQVHSIPERDVGGPNVGYTLPPDPNEDLNGNGVWDLGLTDVTGTDASRDWWRDFLWSRDVVDPTSGLPLPLGGTSRPFRDLGMSTTSASPTNQTIEDTILRRIPPTSASDYRLLFELSNEAEFTGASAPVSPLMRHRLLSKIIGNSTTRSNCFVVFVTIGMFECVEFTPPGTTEPVTRIGAPLLDSAGTSQVTYRKAFIVDRSTAMDAYDRGSGTFDWKKLILAQQRVN